MAAKETCYVYRRPPIDLTRGWAGLSAATAAVAGVDSVAAGAWTHVALTHAAAAADAQLHVNGGAYMP
mgnify:CR=1 FL=1